MNQKVLQPNESKGVTAWWVKRCYSLMSQKVLQPNESKRCYSLMSQKVLQPNEPKGVTA